MLKSNRKIFGMDGLWELRMRQYNIVSWAMAVMVTSAVSITVLSAAAQDPTEPGSVAPVNPPGGTNPVADQVNTELRGPVIDTAPRFLPAQPNKSSKSKKESAATFNYSKARKDPKVSKRMAGYMWLDKAAAANPEIIESISWNHAAAMKLAKHPRLGDIAEGDRYLCRRLTKWKDVSMTFAKNPQADRVIARDPEGMYRAIARWPSIVKVLAKNPLFDQMVVDVPDLADVMAQHM